MNIDSLEAVSLDGVTQWIRIRGSDPSNPVLLLMQQGPGLPIINEVRIFERLLHLEEDFTVVYWDQRGTGRSARPLRRRHRQFEIDPSRMIDDTVLLLDLLRSRFGRPTVVAGFSFGATFGAEAAVRRPDLVAAVVAAGMDIDVRAAEAHTYDFALRRARQERRRRAIRQLEKIGPPPHTRAKEFTTRARWAANFGGVSAGKTSNDVVMMLLGSLVRSPDYSLPDIVRTFRGITSSQTALLPELAGTDLVSTMPALEVPVVLVQGRLDQVAPGEATQRLFDSLTAPSKQLVWFERSAHTPHLDEPERFRRLLQKVKATHMASR